MAAASRTGPCSHANKQTLVPFSWGGNRPVGTQWNEKRPVGTQGGKVEPESGGEDLGRTRAGGHRPVLGLVHP